MSNTITAAFVQQWDTSIRLQAQQSESRLMKAVNDRGQISGDGFTISPQGGDNNGTVTVTATAANETSASKDLGSITFSGEGVTPLTLRVAQAAKPSAEPKTVAQFVAFVKGLAPASGAEASLGEWTGQTVQGYIAANDAGGNLYQMISADHAVPPV